jgi:hypothetical protein
MSRRYGRIVAALGGIGPFAALVVVAVAVTAVLAAWAWFHVSPRNPDLAAYQDTGGPQQDYWPGDAGCEPKQLNSLPPKDAASERERCALAAKNHYEDEAALKEAARSNELAEEGLRLSAQQARAAFVQTIATVLAFGAAILAAVFAGFAAWHAKRSADADNLALAETRESSSFSKAVTQPYLYVIIDESNASYCLVDKVFQPHHRTLVHVVFSLKNYGKTPAIIRDISAETYISRPGLNATFKTRNFFPNEVMLGDSAITKSFLCECDELLSDDDIDQIKIGESMLYFAGSIDFTDIHGVGRTVFFRWRYNCLQEEWTSMGFDPQFESERAR